MLVETLYDRAAAAAYAARWAKSRNPKYYDFGGLGGDCTSFVSQCLYAGCRVMNYTPVFGWYYINLYNRAPAWTDVRLFYDFLTKNKSAGPYGAAVEKSSLMTGDVVQLGDQNGRFYHSLFVMRTDGEILVAAHDDDSLMRPLDDYRYFQSRFLHIIGARKYL